MGRELRRVPVGFSWPLNKIWKGFLNPHPGPKNCEPCDGTGLNDATRIIGEDYYDHDGFENRWRYDYGVAPDGSPATRPPWRIIGECRAWSHDITQDEVEALVRENQLMDLTHTCTREHGWQKRVPFVMPTAAEVNAWSHDGFGHDAVNRHILVEARATRLGVYGRCAECRGRGQQKLPRKAKKRYKTWKPKNPSAGDGWQVWETVSEGSPVTPAFATAEALVDHLVNVGDGSRRYARESARAFVLGSGWAPSMIISGGQVFSGIDCATIQKS